MSRVAFAIVIKLRAVGETTTELASGIGAIVDFRVPPGVTTGGYVEAGKLKCVNDDFSPTVGIDVKRTPVLKTNPVVKVKDLSDKLIVSHVQELLEVDPEVELPYEVTLGARSDHNPRRVPSDGLSFEKAQIGLKVLPNLNIGETGVQKSILPMTFYRPRPLPFVEAVGKGSGQQSDHFQVLEKNQVVIDCKNSIKVSSLPLPVAGKESQRGTRKNVPFQAEDCEIVALLALEIICLSLQYSQCELVSQLAGQLRAYQNGDGQPVRGKTDATAVIELNVR